MRKFGKMFTGGSVIGERCILCVYEGAKEVVLSCFSNADHYLSAPAFRFFVPRHPLEARDGIPIYSSISGIFASCCFSKIAHSVVQRASSGDMVGSGFNTEDFIVHVNGPVFSDSACGLAARVEGKSFWVPLGAPIVSIKAVVIDRIHDGILALRQGNQFNRLIKRLDNLVSFHVERSHGSTLNGIVRHSAAFLLYCKRCKEE